MPDNQPSGSQGQGSGGTSGKPQQTLSWSQPQQGKTGAAASTKSTGSQTAAITPAQSKMQSRVLVALVIGLLLGWLITWSWFDLRSNKSAGTEAMNASSTSEMAGTNGQSALAVTGSGENGSTMNSAMSSSSSQTMGGAAAGQVSSDTITVPSPQPAGTTITVSNLVASGSVWAVVYEDNGGSVGRALGAARFASSRTSGTIELLRATLPGLTYFVGLTADTPTHSFDIGVNVPLTDQSGQRIMTQFTAQ